MIKGEDLRKATDYSKGQKDAAYSVLGEITNLLGEYSDNIRIIGGWVPSLLYPDKEHIGSIDVDVLLNQLKIHKAESYENIKRILTRNGYRRHPEKYFTFIKTVTIDGIPHLRNRSGKIFTNGACYPFKYAENINISGFVDLEERDNVLV